MPVTKICPICGQPFSLPPSHAERVQTCSYTCGTKLHQKTLEERFWEKVNKNGPLPTHCPELGPCWLWTGQRNEHGYGRLWDGTKKSHAQYTHQIAWKLVNGAIPDGKNVLHHCDTPPCCNPAHLFVDTHQANMADRDSKDRVRHGVEHPSSKINETIVKRMRELYDTGNVSMERIAISFDVTLSIVFDVVTGKTWKRAPGPISPILGLRKGENSPSAKLSDRQVAVIRGAWLAGGVTQTDLARLYGLHQATVSRIVRNLRRAT